jgi:hypothetical protein
MNKDCFRLLVGAPFAQSAQSQGLRNTGAVYGCEVDNSQCVELHFDPKRGGFPFHYLLILWWFPLLFGSKINK